MSLNNYMEKYEKIRLISDNNKIKVYIARHKDIKRELAVKVFPNTPEYKSLYEREVGFRNVLTAEPFLEPIEHHENEENIFEINRGSCNYIVSEYAKYGDFHAIMKKSGKKFDEKVARSIFLQMAKSVQYIHEKKIGHLDIKISNFFLDHDFKVILSDFEGSQTFGEAISTKGTMNFRSPERVNEKTKDMASCDIFGLGVVLFILLQGTFPFTEVSKGFDFFHRYFEKSKQQFWTMHQGSRLTEEIKDLINGMLESDPEKRYKLDQILKHPWMKLEFLDPSEYASEMKKFLGE